jgi:hypothetical protein
MRRFIGLCFSESQVNLYIVLLKLVRYEKCTAILAHMETGVPHQAKNAVAGKTLLARGITRLTPELI